jgi:hypothetical protein
MMNVKPPFSFLALTLISEDLEQSLFALCTEALDLADASCFGCCFQFGNRGNAQRFMQQLDLLDGEPGDAGELDDSWREVFPETAKD